VLDRGILVRRLDPAWWTDDQAKEADDDTSYYTNAAPQHERLNQRTWLALDDYLLGNTNNRDMHTSVFTGPVFRDCDVLYRGVRIIEEFWKVVVMVMPAGEPHCTAYLPTQREMLEDLKSIVIQASSIENDFQKAREARSPIDPSVIYSNNVIGAAQTTFWGSGKPFLTLTNAG